MAITEAHKHNIGKAMAARHARARDLEGKLQMVSVERDRLLAENAALSVELAMLRIELAAYRTALHQPRAAA